MMVQFQHFPPLHQPEEEEVVVERPQELLDAMAGQGAVVEHQVQVGVGRVTRPLSARLKETTAVHILDQAPLQQVVAVAQVRRVIQTGKVTAATELPHRLAVRQ